MPSVNSTPQPSFEAVKGKAGTKQTEAAKAAEKASQSCDTTAKCSTDSAKTEISTVEKVALGAAVGGIGAAVAYVALLETVNEKAQSMGKKAVDSVKERYKNPPEEKIVDTIKKGFIITADAFEELVDDVKDGRVARDVSKNTKRFVRDHFTTQTPTDKIKNAVKDAAEDMVDTAADAIDDIKDGRAGKKIAKSIGN